MKQCYTAARPVILEPIMLVELKGPTEFQGTVTGDINKWACLFTLYHILSFVLFIIFLNWKCTSVFNRRKGLIVGNDQDGDDSVITAHVCMTLSSPLIISLLHISGGGSQQMIVPSILMCSHFLFCLNVFLELHLHADSIIAKYYYMMFGFRIRISLK